MDVFFKQQRFDAEIKKQTHYSNSPDLRPVTSNNSPHNQHFFSFATLKNRIFIIQNLQFLFFMSINSQNMTIFCMIFIFKSI